jgi:hypothetical protein
MATILTTTDTMIAQKTGAQAPIAGASSFRTAHSQRSLPITVLPTNEHPKILQGNEPRTMARGLLAHLLGQQHG